MPDASAGAPWWRRQRTPAGAMRIEHPARESAIALGYALFYIVAAVATGLAIRAWPHPIWGAIRLNQDALYTFGFKIGLLLIVPMVAWRAAGYRFSDLLPDARVRRPWRLALPLAYAIGLVVNSAYFGPVAAAAEARAPAETLARVALGVVLPLFTAGIPEEFFFRGILQTRLEAIWGRLAALLVTAALFTAWHIPPRYFLARGAEGVAGDFGSVLLGTGLPVFIAALILGLLWDRWRDLPVLMALHWGVDTMPAVASFFGIQL